MDHKTVIRNEAYQTGSFTVRERHNERKNDEYFNGDVQLERSYLNVHFRQNLREDGTPETYQETFNAGGEAPARQRVICCLYPVGQRQRVQANEP